MMPTLPRSFQEQFKRKKISYSKCEHLAGTYVMSGISNTVSNSSNDSTSVISEIFRVYESSQLIYCGVDRTNRGNDGYTLLFNSSLIAKEAADVLRGDWDGVNAVTVHQPKVVIIRYDDSLVVEYAGESVKLELREREIEFYQQGQYCFLNQLTMHPKTKARSGKSIIVSELMMKALEGEMERGPVEFPV